MNITYIKYESMTASHEAIAKELNHIKQWCRDIQVINSTLGIDQFQRPLLIMLLKLDFRSDTSMKDYEVYKNKTPLSITK